MPLGPYLALPASPALHVSPGKPIGASFLHLSSEDQLDDLSSEPSGVWTLGC